MISVGFSLSLSAVSFRMAKQCCQM